MTTITELWTNRTDLRDIKSVTRTVPELKEGEVLMKIEKLGLTANNVSYAVTGDKIGYWGYFPLMNTGARCLLGALPMPSKATALKSKRANVSGAFSRWPAMLCCARAR